MTAALLLANCSRMRHDSAGEVCLVSVCSTRVHAHVSAYLQILQALETCQLTGTSHTIEVQRPHYCLQICQCSQVSLCDGSIIIDHHRTLDCVEAPDT